MSGSIARSDFVNGGITFSPDIIRKWQSIRTGIGSLTSEQEGLLRAGTSIQTIFKETLEAVMRGPERARDAFLGRLGLAAEELDHNGVKGWKIVAKPTKESSHWKVICTLGLGYLKDSWKAEWHGVERVPEIAKLGKTGLTMVPLMLESEKEQAQRLPYDVNPAKKDGARGLRSYIEWARSHGKLMDMGEKGAYVLDTENSCFVMVPPSSSADDGYDYDKITVKRVSDAKTGGKVDANVLKIIAETIMDSRDKIEEATQGLEWRVHVEKDFSGDLVVRISPKALKGQEFVLDLNGERKKGSYIDISDEAKNNYKQRKEKGPTAKAKEARTDTVWIPETQERMRQGLTCGLVSKDDLPRGWKPSSRFGGDLIPEAPHAAASRGASSAAGATRSQPTPTMAASPVIEAGQHPADSPGMGLGGGGGPPPVIHAAAAATPAATPTPTATAAGTPAAAAAAPTTTPATPGHEQPVGFGLGPYSDLSPPAV